MNCDKTQEQLVAFHFGEIEPEERAAVERHLRECSACVGEWLQLKRDMDLGESAPRPSELVRRRIKASVKKELRATLPRPWMWWERPVAAALACITVMTAVAATGAIANQEAAAPVTFGQATSAGE